uniref:Uncharacterized protein n=1 Tax=Bursaphelenchus xylophilus TaxID=6326 RepID=A0A1I7SPL5_BURXY
MSHYFCQTVFKAEFLSSGRRFQGSGSEDRKKVISSYYRL